MLASLSALLAAVAITAADRPNILVISCEDIGPHLGCYGDSYATTPHLDRLAEQSLRYTVAWSNAPVCAPARTTLIMGLYPPSTGSEHMRSMVPMPAGMTMYPKLLRDAGYYCTNNSKEDYNVPKPEGVWDESSNKAHYKNRGKDQPFFAIFNLTISHESQIRSKPHTLVHDPARARVPAYHPDRPEVRRDWAQYYDKITVMDEQSGRLLNELAKSGLADDTIVIYFSDHGSGMPRNKRCPCNSGEHVPFILHVPEKWKTLAPADYKPGGTTDRPIGFVDFGPTMLSLAGVKPPATMQGVAFLGPHAGPANEYLHGFRGRMDERIDLVRSLRWKNYVYVRNYMPHLPAGQYLAYMFQTPTTALWKKLYDAGELTPEQSTFWKPKAPEELYDLSSDPDEVRNLADSPEHREVLDRLRAELQAHAIRIRDVGLLPEAEMHRRSGKRSPYDMAREPGVYPVERVQAAAEAASSGKAEDLAKIKPWLTDADAGVRYWAVMGHLMRGPDACRAALPDLRARLKDEAGAVRVAAAEALGHHGEDQDLAQSLRVLIQDADPSQNGPYLSIQALNAIDLLGERAVSLKTAIAKLPLRAADAPARANGEYTKRLVEYLTRGSSRDE